jgi:hypothetical protein
VVKIFYLLVLEQIIRCSVRHYSENFGLFRGGMNETV